MARDTFSHCPCAQGEYDDATNTEDDLAIINRYLPYVTDDHGNKNTTATPIASGKPARLLVPGLPGMVSVRLVASDMHPPLATLSRTLPCTHSCLTCMRYTAAQPACDAQLLDLHAMQRWLVAAAASRGY